MIQQTLNADIKSMQQINFTGNLYQAENTKHQKPYGINN